jgi:N6-adenosine-specific RNA methylase IME4
MFEELKGPYHTIVADPPWKYEQGGPTTGTARFPAPKYSMMTIPEIMDLPVKGLAAENAHLYLWTTNRYLRDSFSVAEAWGFKHSQTLVWCKCPSGIGPGGAFSNTAEFILYCRRGSLPYQNRIDRTWWEWKRGTHSSKPPAFLDTVETVSPGPYVELFARQPRMGWDAWGFGHEGGALKHA